MHFVCLASPPAQQMLPSNYILRPEELAMQSVRIEEERLRWEEERVKLFHPD